MRWLVRSLFALFPMICSLPVTTQEELRVALSARAIQPGELVILTATAAGEIDSVAVRAFDRDVPAFRVDSSTWQALVGVDLETRARRYPVSITARAGPRSFHAESTLDVTPHRFPTRRLRVEAAFVNPPLEAQERIGREAKELGRLWTESSPARLWSAPFVRPVPDPSSSRFGVRSVFNGALRSPHSGDDFMSPTGTPVQAPSGGRVVLARELYFSGNTVIVDHGLGLFSLLAHLSTFDVHEGDTVTAGGRVGTSGATGRVTGPHLHWAVRVGGARVDPLSLLSLLGVGEGGGPDPKGPGRTP